MTKKETEKKLRELKSAKNKLEALAAEFDTVDAGVAVPARSAARELQCASVAKAFSDAGIGY